MTAHSSLELTWLGCFCGRQCLLVGRVGNDRDLDGPISGYALFTMILEIFRIECHYLCYYLSLFIIIWVLAWATSCVGG